MWAASELLARERQTREAQRLHAEKEREYYELALAEGEREREALTAKRVDALKRGEVYLPPAPPPMRYVSAGSYPQPSAGVVYRSPSSGATVCIF